MSMYDTEYKDLSYRELITLLENIKPNLLNSYSDELEFNPHSESLNSFYDYAYNCKKILQQLHNNVCRDMSKQLGFEIQPTNVIASKFANVEKELNKNGSIYFGDYDFDENSITVNLLVNFPKNCINYQIKKFSDFWTLELINTVFHETMHYIQQKCFIKNSNSLNNQALFIKKYAEANYYCEYQSDDIRHKYLNNILELDARSFAIKCIEELNKQNQIPFDCTDYIAEKYILENDIIGTEFEHLKFAQNKYKISALNYYDEDYTGIIDEYFNKKLNYYKQIRLKCNEITQENKKLLPNNKFVNSLSAKEINILKHDYENYLNTNNKVLFTQTIKSVNTNLCNNDNLAKFKSLLPEFLKDLEIENSVIEK